MKKVFNALLLLVLVGAILFVVWKAKLIPDPFQKPAPGEPTPAAGIVEREELKIAVAERPEKLMVASLRKLLEVEGLKLELVEYDPDTVWLQLASQDLDLVILPLGEAVQGQGRFNSGRFLFFTGLSEGLDELLASEGESKPQRVAVQRKAATDFLARQMLPEAEILAAGSLQEVEEWLVGGAVQAALIDTSANSPELKEKFRSLRRTSPESPVPTVAVLSRHFAENAADKAYDSRREVLFAALTSWANLVGYLESQPEMLKLNLKQEAQQSNIDIDRLLESYRFLTPSQGRAVLEQFQSSGEFKKTLDFLVLSGVPNLSAPEWEDTIRIPSPLSQGFSDEVASFTPSESRTPPPTDAATTPSPSRSPEAVLSPSETTAVTTQSSQLSVEPTYNFPDAQVNLPWPEPKLKQPLFNSMSLLPALSRSQVAIAAQDFFYICNFDKIAAKVPLSAPPSTSPVSDGRHFFLASEGQILALNSDGKTVWKKTVRGTPLGATRVIGERLVYAIDEADRGRVICLDAIDGELLWEAVLPAAVTCGPVVGSSGAKNLVLGFDKDGGVRAWDFDNGSQVWETTVERPVYTDPGAGYGKFATVDPRGQVRLYELGSGTQVWEADLGTSVSASPTLTPSGVLVPAKDTYLYLLTMGSGDINWKTRLGSPLSQPAVVTKDFILQADEGGKIHQLTTRDGAKGADMRFGDGWVSRPVYRDGRWAVAQDNGTLSLFDN